MPYGGIISNIQQGAMLFPAKESQTVKKESMLKTNVLFSSSLNSTINTSLLILLFLLYNTKCVLLPGCDWLLEVTRSCCEIADVALTQAYRPTSLETTVHCGKTCILHVVAGSQ